MPAKIVNEYLYVLNVHSKTYKNIIVIEILFRNSKISSKAPGMSALLKDILSKYVYCIYEMCRTHHA